MNQTAGDVEAETEKPQNHKHNEDCPKHVDLLHAIEGLQNSAGRSERFPALQARRLGPRGY